MFSNPASCFVDAFTVSWASLYFYAFPPFCQMFTEDFRGTCTSGDYDLTTIWSTQVWWPQLLGMVYVIAVPLVLPKHHDLLSLSYSPQKLHPLRKKLTMLTCPLSGAPSRIEEFQKQLPGSSWLPEGMEQRNSTVSTSRNCKSFVIRGKSITFNHL